MAVLTDKDKAVLFLSINKPERVDLCLGRNMPNMLLSYLYYKKAPKKYQEKITDLLNAGGLLMIDSGAHTFQKNLSGDVQNPKMWEPFLEEYCEFLDKHSNIIFCAANLDIENVVGTHNVDTWNSKYFEPLLKKTNIVFVSHEGIPGYEDDFTGLRRFKEYSKAYKYLGVGQSVSRYLPKYYQWCQLHGNLIHGFAYTSLPTLKQFPMFSVDSTSWTMGERFGATFKYDGKNFRSIDAKHKYVRKTLKMQARDAGIDYEGAIAEQRLPLHDLNLLAWEGFEKEMLKAANLKLRTKPVHYYDKRRGY